MAVKRPICLYGTEKRELALTDSVPIPFARAGSAAMQAINSATDVVLAGTSLVVPANTLLLGSALIGTIFLTTITSGTGVLTLRVRGGALGTVADAVLHTFTFAAATTGTPSARIDFAIHMRSIGAAAQSYGHLQANKTAANGVGGAAQFVTIVGVQGTLFTSAIANTLHIDAQMSAATPVLNVQTASLELQV